MFDAVIFDWDETLADTRQVIIISFQRVLQEIGCNVSDEYLGKQIGIGAKNMFKNALKTANIPFDEEEIDKLLEKKSRMHIDLADRIELFEGALKLLDSLKGKVRIALATMSNRNIVDKLLKEKRVRNYFDFVISADEVLEPKPDPEVFLKCAIALRCQPERCVVIEDSVFGVAAARKAKMKCIAIPSGAYSKEELMKENPDLIVDSIKEKREILDYILA